MKATLRLPQRATYAAYLAVEQASAHGHELIDGVIRWRGPTGDRVVLVRPAGHRHDAARTLKLELNVNGTLEQISATLPANFTIQRFGFIVGREPDGSLSCVDDLAVQVN